LAPAPSAANAQMVNAFLLPLHPPFFGLAQLREGTEGLYGFAPVRPRDASAVA
jgi:hypothetical protein